MHVVDLREVEAAIDNMVGEKQHALAAAALRARLWLQDMSRDNQRDVIEELDEALAGLLSD